jgi:sugar lactone lactonase YvrE
MFVSPSGKRRGFMAVSKAQTRKRRHRLRSRRLGLESLEPRQMLSATTTTLGSLTEDFDGHHHDHHLPAGVVAHQARYETHWIHGEPVALVADPAFSGSLDHGSSRQATSSALYPLTSIPLLHSNPGAPATIYLDFDGHFEPVWRTFTNVTIPAYDRDGDPTTFSDSELALIRQAWAKTAEDFAPFNINVTTEQPPELAEGVPESVANGVALRVAFGGDGNWLGGSSTGIADIGSFTNSSPNVVFVFMEGDGSSDGDIASHEAGHALGLWHQSSYSPNGTLIDEYNRGDGSWSPLMGYVYTPVTVWYNGTTTSPSTFQDDMAVLAGSTNGFGYRPDDHGDTIGTASSLTFDGSIYSGSGIIGTNTDVDAWSFDILTADTYRLLVDPAAIGPNLDAVLELRNAAGELLAAASPALSQAAELSAALLPGSYFALVTKTAAYGWLGAYTLSVAAPPAGVTATSSEPLVTREGGPAATFTVKLDTQPTADVVIPVSSSNPAEGGVSAASLTFTPANWNVLQTVSVMGVADGTRDGDVPYSIVLGAATSGDPEYAGLDASDVAAVNLDNSYSGMLYWSDFGSDVIKRSALNGSNIETVVDFAAQFGTGPTYAPQHIAFDALAGKMYWTDSGTGRIQRASLEGANAEVLVTGLTSGLRGIAVDSAGGKMYWADYGAQKIQRANLDGSSVQDIVTGSLGGVREIALDVAAGKIYWTEYGLNTINRANLDGTNAEILWTGFDANNPTGIALDTSAQKVYWSDVGTDQIFRANFDGSNAEVIIDIRALRPKSTVSSLAIDMDGGKLYFSDTVAKTLYRASLDGSGLVAIASEGVSLASGVAIVRPAISVTPTAGLVTNESGGSAAFQVMLTTPPSGDVTIPVSSGDLTEGSVSTTSLIFTTANWNVPQTVTVTGVDDSVSDGDAAYTVVLGPATSSDPDYSGFDPRDVSLTNLDNEVKFYVVNDASTNLNYQYASDGTSRGNLALNSGNSAPRGVASTIAGDKTWVVDANRKVYVYSTASGALLGSWTAGTLAKNATPEGITTNGTDVWIVDSRSDKVYRYAGAASRISGTQNAASSFSLNSGNTSPKDLVTNGQSIWVVNDNSTDKVFRYSITGGLQGSWTIDSANKSPTGITIDPANVSHIWIVDSGTDRVYQYTGAATRTSGSQSAAVSFALAAGNTNPQGIADPPVPETNAAAEPAVTDVDVRVGILMPKQVEHRASGNGRVDLNDKSFTSTNAARNRLVQSACADLLLAREQFFEAIDQQRLDALEEATLRMTDGQRDKLEFGHCFEKPNARFDWAIDAIFADFC